MIHVSDTVERNRRGILDACARRDEWVEHLPYYYGIHLAMPCNERCIMCVPDGRHELTSVPFEEFVAFFEQIKPVARHITLIGGETFMYPKFKEVLELLARHPITVTIITNATLLTRKVAPRLLALHGLELKCSIDAATRDTYHRIRGRDVFDRVLSNVRDFSALAREAPHVRRILVYVVMRENLDEVLPFIDIARSLDVYRVDFQPVKHVQTWNVTNGTGWVFDGKEQSCEAFRDEFHDVMHEAARKCERLGLRHDIQLV